MTWRYMFLELELIELDGVLNKLGMEGWELVSMVPSPIRTIRDETGPNAYMAYPSTPRTLLCALKRRS